MALARLKVTPERLAKEPNITSFLKEHRGGIKAAFKAMRFSEHPLIQDFLKKYDSLPEGDRDRVPIEAIAIAAKINVAHLWGEMMIAMREHSVNRVKIIAVGAHPDLIKKRVEFAQLPGGFRDRDALDTMLGALPSKSTTFINKFFASGAQAEDDAKEPMTETIEDIDDIFPDCSVMQERVSPVRQKVLTAGK